MIHNVHEREIRAHSDTGIVSSCFRFIPLACRTVIMAACRTDENPALQGYLAFKKTPIPLGPWAKAYGGVLEGCFLLLVRYPAEQHRSQTTRVVVADNGKIRQFVK